MVAEDEERLTPRSRFAAAAGAAVVAATVLNPLDVVKTRIQAQAMAAAAGRAAAGAGGGGADPAALVHTLYERWGICETPLCVRRTPKGLACSSAAAAAARAAPGAGVGVAGGGAGGGVVLDEGIWRALRAIARTEGVASMWRGTSASLLMSAPMVGIYMPVYDHLLAAWAPATGAAAAPVAAGAAARTLACVAVAPFELLRTRLQAAPPPPRGGGGGGGGGGAAALALLRRGSGGGAASLGDALRRLPRMWTGLSATLLRDVPFSALYWAMVEPIRRVLLPRLPHAHVPDAYAAAAAASSGGGAHPHHTKSEILFANLVSGFVAGGLAAAATTPFDVVKTRMQVAPAPAPAFAPAPAVACADCGVVPAGGGAAAAAAGGGRRSAFGEMRAVYEAEGVRGLFVGVRPRAYRAAPACAIVITVYEVLKSLLAPE
ncbi:MAG: mitochondrial carrier domain-containing protein [Monoraphidium minutum]|nr:MAG: mitochondrial carrier domain-containing protein [Monoraphidium minutum]